MNPGQGLGRMLKEKHLTIAVAESLTGGLVGSLITDVPGSSGYFLGGVTTYSNVSKSELLHVREETLRYSGAVSEECAREMAAGVREMFHADIGLAITGIAGPTGATANKPIGLVAFAYDDGKIRRTEKVIFTGDRLQIKNASAEHLIAMAVSILSGNGTDP